MDARWGQIDKSASRFAYLSDEDLWKLKDSGDKQVKEYLLIRSKGLVFDFVKSFVIRFPSLSYLRDDLTQEAMLGLYEAIERFEYDRGFLLATFAYHWIRAYVFRFVYDNRRIVRIPRNLQLKLSRCFSDYLSGKKVAPGGEKTLRYFFAGDFFLDQSVKDDDEEEGDSIKKDFLKSGSIIDEEAFFSEQFSRFIERVEILIRENFPNKIDKMRDIFYSRVPLDQHGGLMTLDAVGIKYGITRERVRQYEAQIMELIKNDPEIMKIKEELIS